MTKIKKSIWSAVVGFVMCLTLVFGVVAGANTHRIAKADPEEAIDYIICALHYIHVTYSFYNWTLVLLNPLHLFHPSHRHHLSAQVFFFVAMRLFHFIMFACFVFQVLYISEII